MPQIRTGTTEDLPTVVDLWERAGGPTHLPHSISEVTRLLERDPDALIVAIVDGRVVGTLIVGWDGWRCHLYRLAVVPDRQTYTFRHRDGDRSVINYASDGWTRDIVFDAAGLVVDYPDIGHRVGPPAS